MQQKLYIIREIFPTSRKVKLIKKKKLMVRTFDPDNIAIIVYIAILI